MIGLTSNGGGGVSEGAGLCSAPARRLKAVAPMKAVTASVFQTSAQFFCNRKNRTPIKGKISPDSLLSVLKRRATPLPIKSRSLSEPSDRAARTNKNNPKNPKVAASGSAPPEM